MLADLDRTIARASAIGVVCSMLGALTIVLGASKAVPPVPAAIAATILVTAAIASGAMTFRKRSIRAVGRLHGWRWSNCEVTERGMGKARRIEIALRGDDTTVLVAADGMSNSNRLRDQELIELAGESPGRFLVRIPGELPIYLYRRKPG